MNHHHISTLYLQWRLILRHQLVGQRGVLPRPPPLPGSNLGLGADAVRNVDEDIIGHAVQLGARYGAGWI